MPVTNGLSRYIDGTTADSFLINIDGTGVLAKDSSGVLEVRDAADSAYAVVRMADPVANNDGANKSYVDNLVGGLKWRDPVRVASQVNIANLAAVTAIDSVTLADGDRVLLKAQTTTGENGLYSFTLGTTTLTRSSDADTLLEIDTSAVFVDQGTDANKGYVLNVSNTGGTLDTEPVTVTQFSSFGSPGDGLDSSFNINTTAPLTVDSDSVLLQSSATANQILLSSGTVLTAPTYGALPVGDSNAVTGTLAVANGGTGLAALGTANQLLRVNAGATALEYYTPGSMPSFSAETGTTISLAADTIYTADNASTITATLPATAAAGSIIRIWVKGTGELVIAQNAGQSIRLGDIVTTTGATGQISSNVTGESGNGQGKAIELMCITANTTYGVMSITGSWDFT